MSPAIGGPGLQPGHGAAEGRALRLAPLPRPPACASAAPSGLRLCRALRLAPLPRPPACASAAPSGLRLCRALRPALLRLRPAAFALLRQIEQRHAGLDELSRLAMDRGD